MKDEIPLEAGQDYTLETAIRLKRRGIDSSHLARRGVNNPRIDKEELTIYVLAKSNWPGIEIAESFARITWPYDADSESALFHLHVKGLGREKMSQGEIDIRLYSGNLDLLDIVRVLVTVVPRLQERKGVPGISARHLLWPDKEPGFLDIDPNSPSRSLSIHVTSINNGYHFDFMFPERNGQRIVIPISRNILEGDLVRILSDVRDFWTELAITSYANQPSVARPTFRRYLDELRRLGLHAWSLLFGDRFGDQSGASEDLGNLLSAMHFSEGTHVQITYGDMYNNFVFPWSILYPPINDSDPVDPFLFWGARYQIEQVRKGPIQDQLKEEPISVLFALDQAFGSSATQKELFETYVAAARNRVSVTSPISTQSDLFSELVRKPPAHLIYFYCHGYTSAGPGSLRPDGIQRLKKRIEDLKPDSPERKLHETLLSLIAKMRDESWIFIGESEVRESQLSRQKFFQKPRRPIVFLNMCQSAALLPSMTSGFVRLFRP